MEAIAHLVHTFSLHALNSSLKLYARIEIFALVKCSAHLHSIMLQVKNPTVGHTKACMALQADRR